MEQTGDDSLPEPRKTFSLELTSATGGADIDADGRRATVTVVASDYPHGLMEFEQPADATVTEESEQVCTTVFLPSFYISSNALD